MAFPEFPITALRALKTLRETGSMTRTAAFLGISQPAVSRAIGTLEQRFGLTFVRRDSRPITLTAEGELVASFSDRIEGDLTDLAHQLARLRHGRTGSVTIGSFGASASTRLLPDLLRSFIRSYPEVTVSIREYDDQELAEALNDRIIDVAVLANPPDRFDLLLLGQDELVGLVPQDDPLAGKASLDPSDFEGRPFILSKAGSEPLIRDWFSANGEGLPPPSHRIRQTVSILAMVEAGLGTSIMARYALPRDVGRVHAIPLAPPAPRDLALVRLPGAAKSQAADLFWQFAERQTG
ncbi:LysR family transcriptional regulator [Roseibium sp. RKSG952]|uniref:LysR family transcriptional regulator n=1 Tax=Roseibium sp. RKSG952 TaxID=2529384 RepID=UPI0018AD2171|nr:LysR family transcriptional regulator [Roseibium sp. RKSG952]